MKKLSLIFATVLFFAGATVTMAQDSETANHQVSISIPTIALVDIEDAEGTEASTITFSIDAADLVTEAGAKPDFSEISDNTLYLQYTSIVSSGNSVSNSISAELSSSDLPDGLSLQVAASASAAGGKVGTTGTGNTTAQTLSSSATDVVTGIGSCYTGTNGAKGHQLTYTLDVEETDAAYAALTAGSFDATVLYTITEN